jgi:hypothetical protein
MGVKWILNKLENIGLEILMAVIINKVLCVVTSCSSETDQHIGGSIIKLHGLSPRANYTDCLTDRRLSAKLVSTFADRGCHVGSVTDPYGCILGFLDQIRGSILVKKMPGSVKTHKTVLFKLGNIHTA